ncbi:MAG: polysaccharide biosynthesis/export family protein [Pseudomonadota bacterium]
MRILPFLFLLVLSSACATPANQAYNGAVIPTNAVVPTTYGTEEYRIQPGDTFDIKFFYNPELNETVIVRPDGRISLQLAHDVAAAGLTPAKLSQTLVEKYRAEIRQPEIAIIVRTFSAERVYVDGEVFRPGMITLAHPVSILQALSTAGGMRDSARDNEVVLIRRGPDGKPAHMIVNVEAIRNGADLSQDILLAPCDIVFVPKSPIANVNKFVDLYIRKNIPVGVGFGFGYELNNE